MHCMTPELTRLQILLPSWVQTNYIVAARFWPVRHIPLLKKPSCVASSNRRLPFPQNTVCRLSDDNFYPWPVPHVARCAFFRPNWPINGRVFRESPQWHWWQRNKTSACRLQVWRLWANWHSQIDSCWSEAIFPIPKLLAVTHIWPWPIEYLLLRHRQRLADISCLSSCIFGLPSPRWIVELAPIRQFCVASCERSRVGQRRTHDQNRPCCGCCPHDHDCRQCWDSWHCCGSFQNDEEPPWLRSFALRELEVEVDWVLLLYSRSVRLVVTHSRASLPLLSTLLFCGESSLASASLVVHWSTGTTLRFLSSSFQTRRLDSRSGGGFLCKSPELLDCWNSLLQSRACLLATVYCIDTSCTLVIYS